MTIGVAERSHRLTVTISVLAEEANRTTVCVCLIPSREFGKTRKRYLEALRTMNNKNNSNKDKSDVQDVR